MEVSGKLIGWHLTLTLILHFIETLDILLVVLFRTREATVLNGEGSVWAMSGPGLHKGLYLQSLLAIPQRCMQGHAFFKGCLSAFRAVASVSEDGWAAVTIQWTIKMRSLTICDSLLSLVIWTTPAEAQQGSVVPTGLSLNSWHKLWV